jgi:hypothetical protein
MRKLEGLVTEIVDEMTYLKKREERFTNTNGTSSVPLPILLLTDVCRVDTGPCAILCFI